MADKYHNKWIIQDIVSDVRIFKAQSRAFCFLSDMASDLDSSIEMLEGIEHLAALVMQLDLMKRKLCYLKMANEIGNQFGGVT